MLCLALLSSTPRHSYQFPSLDSLRTWQTRLLLMDKTLEMAGCFTRVHGHQETLILLLSHESRSIEEPLQKACPDLNGIPHACRSDYKEKPMVRWRQGIAQGQLGMTPGVCDEGLSLHCSPLGTCLHEVLFVKSRSSTTTAQDSDKTSSGSHQHTLLPHRVAAMDHQENCKGAVSWKKIKSLGSSSSQFLF